VSDDARWGVGGLALVRELHGAGSPGGMALHPDGSLLAVGNGEGKLRLWRLPSGKRHRVVDTAPPATRHERGIRSLAFTPDGAALIAGREDQTLQLWPKEADAPRWTSARQDAWLPGLAVSPDGEYIAAAGGRVIRRWRTSDGARLADLGQHEDGVACVALSPGGEVVASGSYDATIRLWRAGDGALLHTLSGHPGAFVTRSGGAPHAGCAWTVAFSPDGALLASGGFDAKVRLWRVQDGALLHTLGEHAPRGLGVSSVAFSPGGGLIASAADDYRVLFWRVRDGALVGEAPGRQERITSLLFTPGGALLLSLSWDKKVRLFAPASSA
jgi:WD40 repeat protein